jgi:hypothetical protein
MKTPAPLTCACLMFGVSMLSACGGLEDRNTSHGTPATLSTPASATPSPAVPAAMTRGAIVQIEVAIGEAICVTNDEAADQIARVTPKVPQGVVGSSSATVVHGGRLVSSRERVLR